MLLAIDAGNTNVVFAVFDGQHKKASWRISTDDRRTADEYAVWLTHLMGLINVRPVDVSAAIIGSVVPPATYQLVSLCRHHFDREPLVVGRSPLDLGIEVVLSNPLEAGADRIVNAAAAKALYPTPLIVIDFGTATTFDVVDREGRYVGGAIAPGINLSVEVLHQAAAKLPRVDVARPAKVIGTDTQAAMKSGIFWGYVGLIEGLVSRIVAEHGADMTVIGTGGLAPMFADAATVIDKIDRDLTIRGLWQIYERNRPETDRPKHG